MEKNLEIAHATLEEKFVIPLKGHAYPPRAYVHVECMSFTLSGADLGDLYNVQLSKREAKVITKNKLGN